jgi:hypothetical protein
MGLETAVRSDDNNDANVPHDQSLATVARYTDDPAQLQPEIEWIERSRTTLAQRVFGELHATVAALRMSPVQENSGDVWKESSVPSSTA